MSIPENGSKTPRREMAFVGAWNTVTLDQRNPYAVTFWSIAYAGLGHILLEHYLRGFILLIGEVILNYAAHLNMAIYYTMTGSFVEADRVLDKRWFLLYIAIYCFAIFDSYRETVEVNSVYRLAERENARLKTFAIKSSGFTMVSTGSPLIAALLSAVLPGMGCFMLQRMNRAMVLMALWIGLTYMSGFYPALIDTFAGEYGQTTAGLNIQWFLNLPSVWLYSIYEAFNCAVETNKLYRKEQSQFLKREYQSAGFVMPACFKVR